MEQEIYHYGIKGMKWGVRKDYRRNRTHTSHRKKSHDENYKTARRQLTKRQIGEAVALTLVAAATGYAIYKTGKTTVNGIGHARSVVSRVKSKLGRADDSKSKQYRDMGVYVTEILSDGSPVVRNIRNPS